MNTTTLIMMNMTYHHLWQQGLVNRNYHILRQIQQSGKWSRIISVDVLPISQSKKLRVALSSRPWSKHALTQKRTLNYRIDSDPVFASTQYVSAYGLKGVYQALKSIGVDIRSSLVWSYDPFTAEHIMQQDPAVFVFDAVDNWIEHPVYRKHGARLQSAYEYIRSQADVIFTVSEGLVDFFDRGPNVFFVPNGVDYQHFALPESEMSATHSPHDNPVIVYHGVIQSRMNFSILEYLAQKHPEYIFQCIGPVWKDAKNAVKRLSQYKNIQWLGPVPYMRLPQVIREADCAIIPHKIDALTHSMNPLKLYEYLASGVPVVATPVAGVEQFQDLVKIAISPEDFSVEIKKILATDSPELRQRRMAMASQHGWEKRFELMYSILCMQTKKR